MPLQSHEGCASCTFCTTSFNTSSSAAPEATSASTSDLKSSRRPVFSPIDGILPYLERLPPMITLPRIEIPKPCRGGFQTRPGFKPTQTRTALSGEEPRRIPHQDDAVARGVLGHADQLPAVARSPVDRLLQGSLRGDTLADVQRSVLRVVALGLRTVGRMPLSLSHVLPPFFLLPFGQTFPHMHDATHRGQVHPRKHFSWSALQPATSSPLEKGCIQSAGGPGPSPSRRFRSPHTSFPRKRESTGRRRDP